MTRPRIKLGIDDRLLMLVASLLVCAGCLVQHGGSDAPKKPSGQQTVVELSRLAQLEWLKASADAIDGVADRVKSGELKYDGGLQQALQEAFNAGLDGPHNRKLSAEMSKVISPGTRFDPIKTEAVLRANAKGRRALK